MLPDCGGLLFERERVLPIVLSETGGVLLIESRQQSEVTLDLRRQTLLFVVVVFLIVARLQFSLQWLQTNFRICSVYLNLKLKR